MVPKREWMIWSAGFFDGEGTIYISKQTQLIVSVGQRILEPLEVLQRLYGGSLRLTSTDQHLWFISSGKASNALQQMLPWLTVKRSQATLAIEFQALVGKPGTNSTPPKKRARRLEIAEELRRMKRPWLVDA